MNAIDWLKHRDVGFAALEAEDQNAIVEFALLWTYFEADSLAAEANGCNIVALAEKIVKAGGILPARFKPLLVHFRERYLKAGNFTRRYDQLRFGKSDYETVVKNVLIGATDDGLDQLSALLLIVFRLKNSLFHGNKWADNVRDQRKTVDTAIELLKAVMEVLPATA